MTVDLNALWLLSFRLRNAADIHTVGRQTRKTRKGSRDAQSRHCWGNRTDRPGDDPSAAGSDIDRLLKQWHR